MRIYGILLIGFGVLGFVTAPAGGFFAGFCYGTTFVLGVFLAFVREPKL